jgi:hypothetical protein
MSTLDPAVTGRRPPVKEPPLKKSGRRGRRARKTGGRQKARAPPEPPLTLSVPEAGKKYYGLSKNGSYAAADRGEIPTVRVGKLRRVPVRLMERILDEAETAEARRQREQAVA